MLSWRKWRQSSRNRLGPQSLPRLRAPVAREELPLRGTPSAAPSLLRRQNQVTFSKFVQLGAPLGLHYSQAAWVRPCGMYPFCLCL